MLKGRNILIEEKQKEFNIFLDYISLNDFYHCPHSVGEEKNLKEIKEYYLCELIEKENRIPSVFIPDEKYLIFGYYEKKDSQVKIMVKAKLKHVSTKLETRKNKIYMDVVVRSYNSKLRKL